MDNGPQFLGETFISWAKSAGMAIQYIQPGKPNQNAYIERFNRTYREEVLDLYLFAILDDVREATYWWCSSTTRNDPMTHWVTALLRKPGGKLPETLLLNCRVDREAYALGVFRERLPHIFPCKN